MVQWGRQRLLQWLETRHGARESHPPAPSRTWTGPSLPLPLRLPPGTGVFAITKNKGYRRVGVHDMTPGCTTRRSCSTAHVSTVQAPATTPAHPLPPHSAMATGPRLLARAWPWPVGDSYLGVFLAPTLALLAATAAAIISSMRVAPPPLASPGDDAAAPVGVAPGDEVPAGAPGPATLVTPSPSEKARAVRRGPSSATTSASCSHPYTNPNPAPRNILELAHFDNWDTVVG